jgi:hypothetical protein
MRRTSILAFIISLSALSVRAQQQKTDSVAPTPRTERYGLHIGADLYKLAKSAFDKDYKGVEFVGSYRLTRRFWVAGEIGNENKTTDDDQLNFTTKGTYFKAGFDYNCYENWLNMENQVSIGLRYGVSSFSQTLNTYGIYNPYPYFGQAPIVESGEKFNGLSAGWIEVVAAVKAELFANLYAGFSLRVSRLVSNKQPENFENLYIPGFNRTYGGNFGAGFNYTLTYFLPIYKKKVSAAKKESGKKPKK